MGRAISRLGILVCSALLASCGGGESGGGGGGGGAANSPPAFTSAATVMVPENSAGTVYTATATDANGDPVTFSISGGADAGLLQIAGGGALSFRSPPDFDVPGDANRDNVYEVTLAAGDGQASTTLALRITLTDVVGGGFQLRRVGTGFVQPVFLTAMPDGSGRVLVVERRGRIHLLNPATGSVAPIPFLAIKEPVSTDGERGLLGVALAPDFMTATFGKAWVVWTRADGALVVSRFSTDMIDKYILDGNGNVESLIIPHPRNNHYGGWLGFGPDGLLYIATGDGGGANDPDMNGQNRNTLLGKILRIDITKAVPNFFGPHYGIPPTNPFANGGGAPEVWAYGLRNPYRASFDRATGELWIGDVGQGAIEEVDRLSTTQAGLNFGWPLYEGTQPLFGTGPAGITMPVTQYAHGAGPLQGNSIIGGYVYRGPVERLQGLYIFADFISNNIWSVPIAGLTQGTTSPSSAFTNRNADFTPNAGSLTQITSFGEDQAGNLFIVTLGGDIFMIQPSS